MELRFKIKHSYNCQRGFIFNNKVGIALQNQARLQRIEVYGRPVGCWNCASKSSTVTTQDAYNEVVILLELRFKIKHGYNCVSRALENI
ncbi:hypothetical protein [Empedobacter falsenii]|uniref:hypothetical protein n=1 Tax=Empedobacter falsenii TaxID=343874 RepID=UPI003A8041E5